MSTIQTHVVKAQALESITSFVAENTRVRGDLESVEGENLGLKIDGQVQGSIKIAQGGLVHIGPTGKVEGELIEADYILVEGTVDGSLVGRLGVELAPSASVKGSVRYHGVMNMHSMAKVRGTVEYLGK